MRFRETGHFAKEFRESSGAGVKRMRVKRPLLDPKLVAMEDRCPGCMLVHKMATHLCDGRGEERRRNMQPVS